MLTVDVAGEMRKTINIFACIILHIMKRNECTISFKAEVSQPRVETRLASKPKFWREPVGFGLSWSVLSWPEALGLVVASLKSRREIETKYR